MSIGNYLKRNGWDATKDIISRTNIEISLKQELASKTIKPKSNIGDLIAIGVPLDSKLDQTQKAQILYLEGEQTKNSSIVGLHNFYVITTYNRNVMYALAVLELGESIEGILSPDVF